MQFNRFTIGAEEDFKGVVDLIKNRAIIWDEAGQGATFDVVSNS